MKIEEAIQQSTFKDEFEKADINLIYTVSWMNLRMHHLLKNYDVSQQQFNILRILRGQQGNAVSLKLITERMIDQMSNTSRLVEKMQKKDLLIRKPCLDNRRQVEISLTEKGLEVCNMISDEIENQRSVNIKISEEEARELNRILDKIRS